MSRIGRESQSKARKITLIVLGVVLAGTVFLLPQIVSEPWLAGNVDNLPAVPKASPSAVAPSTAAELKRYRQDSQSVLAEIVAMRDRLQQRNVERWAEVEFQQAMDQIAVGDERYSFGDYEASLQQFRQARDLLAEIEETGRQKLTEAVSAARAAVESLNLTVATTSIELAGAIAQEDPQVQALAARIAVLGEVAGHIEAGDAALARNHFEEAQAAYRRAVGLDPEHERAADSLAQANREVTDSAFRGHMSRGFAALERQEYEQARAAFRDAGRIYPGDAAVAKALAQVENRESGDIVSRELGRAADLESSEQWREAVEVYEKLLEQDSSLTDARVKLIPSRVRADLDDKLAGYIEEPLRLSSESGYTTARTALQDAKGIASPGPRLAGQIAQLESLLDIANSPVDVVFRSDNQTHVVLFRVAELGRFEQVSVKLRPGKYVVSGTRDGYRDVRVEFTVTGDSKQSPIVVRCEDPIG